MKTGITLHAIITFKDELIKSGKLKEILLFEYGHVLEYKKNGKYPKTKFYFGRMQK